MKIGKHGVGVLILLLFAVSPWLWSGPAQSQDNFEHRKLQAMEKIARELETLNGKLRDDQQTRRRLIDAVKLNTRALEK